FMIRVCLERRRSRWSLNESNFSIYRWADEEKKSTEKPSEDERRALMDVIVPAALQYIDEHYADFDRKRLERAIFEDSREQVILCLRQHIEEVLIAAADDAKDIASGPYSYCRGPAFANLRKTL